MSLADGSTPAGVPADWRQAIWPAFEFAVLEVVCEACRVLQNDPNRKPHWEERHYSWAMHRHLERVCLRRNLPFSPRYDPHMLSDAEFKSGASPKSAPLLDIVVRWRHNVPEIYFGIEAKILVTTNVGTYTRSKTVANYVAKGIGRYVKRKYAAELPTASMLGYVLAGDTRDLVDGINRRIESLRLPCKQPLAEHVQTTEALPRYYSNHPRVGTTPIYLHHLFILF